jgi:hypothetical protein
MPYEAALLLPTIKHLSRLRLRIQSHPRAGLHPTQAMQVHLALAACPLLTELILAERLYEPLSAIVLAVPQLRKLELYDMDLPLSCAFLSDLPALEFFRCVACRLASGASGMEFLRSLREHSKHIRQVEFIRCDAAIQAAVREEARKREGSVTSGQPMQDTVQLKRCIGTSTRWWGCWFARPPVRIAFAAACAP